jgi:phage terminase large subunit-like protein
MPNDVLALFAEFYLPEDSSTAMAPEISDYISLWAEEGHLNLTPGAMADHDLVRTHIENFCELFDVQAIACDPFQAHNTVKRLYDGSKPVVVYPNNAKTMTAPTDDLLSRIETRRIVHNGNPTLSWHIQNVHGDRSPNGQILPRKDKKDSPRKIDGFVASVFANGVRMNPEEAKPAGEATSVNTDPYQYRGLIGADNL